MSNALVIVSFHRPNRRQLAGSDNAEQIYLNWPGGVIMACQPATAGQAGPAQVPFRQRIASSVDSCDSGNT